jgi:glycosyltransferase involved in cell wall biosynthesis
LAQAIASTSAEAIASARNCALAGAVRCSANGSTRRVSTLVAVGPPLSFLKRLRILRGEIRSSRPDAVISFLNTTNVLALMATMGTKIPVLISERCDPGMDRIPAGWRLLRRLTYPQARGIVMQTERAAGYFRPRLDRLLTVIPNPVETPGLDLTPEDARIGAFSIVSLGRFTPQKGFDLLLTAFARAREKHPEWELVLYGSAGDLEAHKRLVADLGIGSRVRFPGGLRTPPATFRNAGFFVSSSRFEGFPNALCEAMACGLPVIATDCPSGPREIITDGVDGLLVPNEDVPALAAAMERLMGDPDLRKRLGEQASAITVRFSVAKVAALWEDLLRNSGNPRFSDGSES